MARLLALLLGCSADASPAPPPPEPPAAWTPPGPADPFDAFLAADLPVADGFSPPSAGAPCGPACWRLARPGPVHAVAAGIVLEVGETTLVTEHLWYEDQERRTARLRWEGVTPTVPPGTRLRRGDVVGTAATLTLADPDLGEGFFTGHPRLPVPQSEPTLALVSHDLDQLRLYDHGRAIGTFEVGFGQAEGDKERRGDNRTPKGVYFVVARSRGPFTGAFSEYYGGYWIKLGYPNAWDAARGVDEGLFGPDVQRAITTAFWARREPLQGTRLGGGIGLHGWAYEWPDEGGRAMSWGCVVMHLRDAQTIYDTLKEGTMVVLF